MISIVKMCDASNNDVYPITHLRAVRDSNGTTLESMIQGVNETTVGYYECTTAGSTPEKTITIDSSVSLSVRISCKVKFAEKNTGANATMNINNTGAKPLFYNGVRAAANNSWYTNEIVDLYFDGTNYQAKSCTDTLEYDVSLHQTHEITEVTTTTRTVVYNGDVTSGWENETSVSDSSVNGYARTETNTGKDNDTTTVDRPTAKYDTASNKTRVVYVTKRTLTHVVNDYTFDEAVNAVPMSYRHGGLKLRFISNNDGSGGKYLCYFLNRSDWSNSIADWEKTNLENEVKELERKEFSIFKIRQIVNTDEILFTAEDVRENDILYFEIQKIENTDPAIALYDTSGTRLSYRCFKTGSVINTILRGEIQIPANFAFAKIIWSQAYVLRIAKASPSYYDYRNSVDEFIKNSFIIGDNLAYESKQNAAIDQYGEISVETTQYRYVRIYNVNAGDAFLITSGIGYSLPYALYTSRESFDYSTCYLTGGIMSGILSQHVIIIPHGVNCLAIAGVNSDSSCYVKKCILARERINTLEKKSKIINDYFLEGMDNVVTAISDKMTSPCLVLNIVTDTHESNDADNVRRTTDTLNNITELNTRVKADGVVHLGDLIMPRVYPSLDDNGIYEKMSKYITRLSQCNNNIFPVIGNHDGQHANNYQPNRWYAIAGRLKDPFSVQPQYLTNSNFVKYLPAYYYRDYASIKTRCVFLSVPENDEKYTYAMSQDQLKWFAEVALNVENGTNIIIFAHIVPFDTDFSSKTNQYLVFKAICDAFYTHSVFSKTDSGYNINVDYTTKINSRILAYIGGHQHFDHVAEYGWTYDGKDNNGNAHLYENEFHFPVVNIGAGLMTTGFDTFGGVSPDRTDRTLTQDLWDTMVYVPAEEKIYFIRFGAGDNREINV